MTIAVHLLQIVLMFPSLKFWMSNFPSVPNSFILHWSWSVSILLYQLAPNAPKLMLWPCLPLPPPQPVPCWQKWTFLNCMSPPALTALPLLSPLVHVDSLRSESAPVQPWMFDHVALPRISVPIASHSWDHRPHGSTTLPCPSSSDWSAVSLPLPQTSGPSAALRPRLLLPSASHEYLVTLPSAQSSGTLAQSSVAVSRGGADCWIQKTATLASCNFLGVLWECLVSHIRRHAFTRRRSCKLYLLEFYDRWQPALRCNTATYVHWDVNQKALDYLHVICVLLIWNITVIAKTGILRHP